MCWCCCHASAHRGEHVLMRLSHHAPSGKTCNASVIHDLFVDQHLCQEEGFAWLTVWWGCIAVAVCSICFSMQACGAQAGEPLVEGNKLANSRCLTGRRMYRAGCAQEARELGRCLHAGHILCALNVQAIEPFRPFAGRTAFTCLSSSVTFAKPWVP